MLEILLVLVSVTVLAYVARVWREARATQVQGRAEIYRAAPGSAPLRAPAPLAEGTVLGEIAIPRLGVSRVILEGTEPGTLRRAVGHIRGTAMPGQPGNIALAGHRDTYFRPLRNIRIGDEVILRTAAGAAVYRVHSTQIVRPDNVEVLNNTQSDTLTLVTCYPFRYIGPAPERFIVRAVKTPAPVSDKTS
ncbi:MAG TPA: class D sortase [Bryobacteraceae bacterium]|nr:class D sortase [Bryobacteraceae bacterium]